MTSTGDQLARMGDAKANLACAEKENRLYEWAMPKTKQKQDVSSSGVRALVMSVVAVSQLALKDVSRPSGRFSL